MWRQRRQVQHCRHLPTAKMAFIKERGVKFKGLLSDHECHVIGNTHPCIWFYTQVRIFKGYIQIYAIEYTIV